MARSIGARLRIPAVETSRHPDSNPYFALEAVPTGEFTGSVLTIWDDGPVDGGALEGGTAPPPVTSTVLPLKSRSCMVSSPVGTWGKPVV